MRYLIVGGVAGGATVAARLRRLDEQAEIILFERGEFVSYANCGLPYYIGGTITDRSDLFVQTKAGFTKRFCVDVRVRHEVISVDSARKLVRVVDLLSGKEYDERYDKLVLSPGAEPLRPAIEGIGSDKIFTLRSVPDTDKIKTYIQRRKVKRAVIVGGGFIGLEMAENLYMAGAEVFIVEMADQVMAPVDYSMAAIVHQHLLSKGIHLMLGNGVTRFEDRDEELCVSLSDGKQLVADMALLSIGIRPENQLAKSAGLQLGERGGIVVNDYMQTSDPDIYALGDAAEIKNLVTGKPVMIPLAGPANKQGRIVANNIVFGNKSVYRGAMGTSIAKVFDLTVAAVGMNAKQLKKANIPYMESYTHGASHAGYYPGGAMLSVKILFEPDNGRLLGAQVVGQKGVDKRIEMLAQTIQRAGTVYDLAELEHAYAPPYASAKDPVNMAGFVAENILQGLCRIITWREVSSLGEHVLKIDVRTPKEYQAGTIPGFINIPLDELRSHLDELPKERPIVVTCAVGLRGYLASRILLQHGFTDVRNLSGGYRTWNIASHF